MKKNILPLVRKRSVIFAGALTAALVMLVYYGCQKSDTSTVKQDQTLKRDAFVKDYLAKNPQFTIVPMNEKLDLFAADAQGNILRQIKPTIVNARLHSGVITNGSGSCYPTAPPPSIILLSQASTQVNSCNASSTRTIKAVFQISTINPIVTTSAYNPSLKTKGTYRITNSLGATIFSNLNINIPAANIVNNGPDPANAGFTLFTVTYILAGVPSSYFQSGGAGAAQYFACYFETNCADEMNPNYQDPNTGLLGQSYYFVSSKGTIVNLGSISTCDIISPVTLITPYMFGYDTDGFVEGVAFGGCNPNHTPSLQKIIFYNHGSTTPIYTVSINPANSFDFNPTTIVPFPFVNGNLYDYQYQNIVTGTGACTGPLSPITTVTW